MSASKPFEIREPGDPQGGDDAAGRLAIPRRDPARFEAQRRGGADVGLGIVADHPGRVGRDVEGGERRREEAR